MASELRDRAPSLPPQGPAILFPKPFDSRRHPPVTRDPKPNICPPSPGLGTGVRQMHSPGPEGKLPQLFPGGGMMTHCCKLLKPKLGTNGTRPRATTRNLNGQSPLQQQRQNRMWRRQPLPHLIPTPQPQQHPPSPSQTPPSTQPTHPTRRARPNKNPPRP